MLQQVGIDLAATGVTKKEDEDLGVVVEHAGLPVREQVEQTIHERLRHLIDVVDDEQVELVDVDGVRDESCDLRLCTVVGQLKDVHRQHSDDVCQQARCSHAARDDVGDVRLADTCPAVEGDDEGASAVGGVLLDGDRQHGDHQVLTKYFMPQTTVQRRDIDQVTAVGRQRDRQEDHSE